VLDRRGRDERARLFYSVHVQGLRRHFLAHMSRTEHEHLVTALGAVLDDEGSPPPPLTAS
jgi:hypothetical protein